MPDDFSLEKCKNCKALNSYKHLKLLYEISNLLNSYEDIGKSIEKSLNLLKNEQYFERGALFVYEEENNYLSLFASVGLTSQQKKLAIYKLGEGATGLAAKAKEPVVIENIHNNILYLNKLGTRNTSIISYVAVPIIKQNKLLGVVSANLSKESKVNFEEIISMLTIFGSLSISALNYRKKIEKEKEELKELKNYYENESFKEYRFENIIAKSTKMKKIFNLVEKIAPSDATVLIRGETGTGKELIATAIHNLSRRKNGPLIKLNCAAISETLLESELFGHEKGAFTDAKETKKGRFELANGGTLFLDEIGDISPNMQVKLLRVLQEQEFERVGGVKTIKTDVRLIAATNRNLEQMVEKGEFRKDLYYRLNVIPVNLPPLRERYEDVPLIINFYLNKFMKENDKNMYLSKEAMELLLQYPWPGNIRELQNIVERIVLICPAGEIKPEMLDFVLPYSFQKVYGKKEAEIDTTQKVPTKKQLQEIEKEAITKALIKTGGVQTKAAKLLGMTTRQIGYKIKKYNIKL
jgi:Nif-specific regulatory protein